MNGSLGNAPPCLEALVADFLHVLIPVTKEPLMCVFVPLQGQPT